MSGNTFGLLFSVTSFGESHGPALGGVVDGCPPGMKLCEEDLHLALARRRPGRSRYTSQRREPDHVEILSGVFEGMTTGTPIALLIRNQDARSRDYEELRDRLRPNHADYVYMQKYGRRDHRGGGRASARETVVRVAAGAIAAKYLREQCGIVIRACLSALGDIQLLDIASTGPGEEGWQETERNPFFCPDARRVAELESFMQKLRKEGDSIGAEIFLCATGVPPGLGEPVYGKLDADLAAALMSINAVKAMSIGDGFAVVRQRGSEHRDAMQPQGFAANHSGGVAGGISTGQDLILRVALKPTSSILLPGQTVDSAGQATEIVVKGRHDPCVGLRAVPIVEAMSALVLMDHYLRQRAQNADVQPPFESLAASQPRNPAEQN